MRAVGMWTHKGENRVKGGQAILIVLQVLTTPSVVPASPGSLLEMRKLRYHPRPPSQNLHFNKILERSLCPSEIRKHWFRKPLERLGSTVV